MITLIQWHSLLTWTNEHQVNLFPRIVVYDSMVEIKKSFTSYEMTLSESINYEHLDRLMEELFEAI